MRIQDLKIVNLNREESEEIGRCTYCDANNICGRPKFDFHCNATMSQHYIDIKKERKRKLIKIQNENY